RRIASRSAHAATGAGAGRSPSRPLSADRLYPSRSAAAGNDPALATPRRGHHVMALDALARMIEDFDQSWQRGPQSSEEQNDATAGDQPGGPRAVSDRRPRRTRGSRP